MTERAPSSRPDGTGASTELSSAAGSVGTDQAPSTAKSDPPAPPRPAVSEPRKGQVISKKYRLDRLIARGGMGAVWAGMDLALERPVAIKFMDPAIAASKGLRTRFNREAKAAAQLRTPYVVQIHEHGVHFGLPYIVMELLEGEDLHARLRRERRLPLKTAARIVTQAAKALKKAHALGIVHRDLKPQNIFLAEQDDELVAKILDFGIAKRTVGDKAGGTTKTGQVLGSPHYMSPEQARGLKHIDHRSDLWSLGVILYRMITGRKAFTGEATGDVIVKICTDPLPVASTRAPGLPKEVDAFFERALARNPDDRFQSALDLAQAFADVARAASDVALFTPPPDSDEEAAELALTTPISSDAGLAPPTAADVTDAAPVALDSGVRGPSSPGNSAVRPIAAAPGSSTPVELTPAPPSGPTGPSLAAPSVVDVVELPLKKRTWLPWVLGAMALVTGGIIAVAVMGPPTAETDGDSAAAAAAEPSPAACAEPAPEPTEEAPEPTTEPTAEPMASAAPTATATATAAAKPPAVAKPSPPPPQPRPSPRPAPTPTKTVPAWGY